MQEKESYLTHLCKGSEIIPWVAHLFMWEEKKFSLEHKNALEPSE
jgi:hypothetical protein